MRKKNKKTMSLSLILAAVLTITLISPLAANAAADTTHAKDWMSMVSDDVKLSSISIPGTHDSASRYCTIGFFTSCQDSSMLEQLQNGYRYLDIRLMLNDNKDGFILNHGTFKCRQGLLPWSDPVTYKSLCEDTYAFLQENPTETVIFAVKIEKSDDDVATCERLILDEIAANYDKWYTNNSIPALGDVRGKIVLARRYDDVVGAGEENSGLNFMWEDQNEKSKAYLPYALSMINSNESLWVQDRYKYTLSDKFEAFSEGLDNSLASDDTFFINFLSLSGQSLLPYPKGNANELNMLFMNKELKKLTSYGIIVLDRANDKMASKIYETNY